MWQILFILLIVLSAPICSNEAEMQITILKSFETNCNNKNNIVWIGTTNGLYVSNSIKTQKVEGIKETHIKNILFEKDKFWITTHNGLYYIQANNLNLAKSIKGLEDKIIVKFFNLPNGNLIALDHKKNIYLINIQNNSAEPYNELTDFKIHQIKEEENIIWLIGINGLYKINKNSPEQAIAVEELNNKTIIQIKDNWIITLYDGLYKINNSEIKAINGLEGKQITQFKKINDLWLIGTLKDGLYYIKDNQLFSIPALASESISLIENNHKYIYIPLDYSGGLFALDINKLENNGFKITNLNRKRILEIIAFNDSIWLKTAHGEVFKLENNISTKIADQIAQIKLINQNLFLINNNKGAYVLLNGSLVAIKGLEDYKINAIYFKEGLYWLETYDHHIFIIKPENINQALYQPAMFGINIWSIAKYKNKYIIGSNKGAYSMNENYEAYLIENTKDESTTSIINICNQLWIGTLNGYQIIDF